MANMQNAQAFYGHLDQSLVLVLKGQVHYMMARALRSFLDTMIERKDSDTTIIDLRELEAIDSTGMGLLARLGRTTLSYGRRSVIVCATRDVMTCLRSASFDTLFIMVDEWPLEEEVALSEVPLDNKDVLPDVIGKLILEAHRDLADMSDDNRQTFGGVVRALETDVARKNLH
jgi:anti-anti-sigma factor